MNKKAKQPQPVVVRHHHDPARTEANKQKRIEAEKRRQERDAMKKVQHHRSLERARIAARYEADKAAYEAEQARINERYEADKAAYAAQQVNNTRDWLLGAHRKAMTATQRIEETHTQPLTREEYIKAGLIRPQAEA